MMVVFENRPAMSACHHGPAYFAPEGSGVALTPPATTLPASTTTFFSHTKQGRPNHASHN